jgi:hypothetical protein
MADREHSAGVIRPSLKHGKRPLFPDGYDCANPFNRGRFTAQAKAERAMTMRARREFSGGYSGAFGGGRFTRAARVASGRETAADRIVMARREAAAQLAFKRASMPHERKPRKPMDPERMRRFTAMGRAAQAKPREEQRRKQLIAIDEAAERKREAAERAAEWCTWNARKHPKTPE